MELTISFIGKVAIVAAVIFIITALQGWKERGKIIGTVYLVPRGNGIIDYNFTVDPSVTFPSKGFVKFKVVRVNNNVFNEQTIKEVQKNG